MAQDYIPMWKSLGLDLEAHNALLGILGQVYRDTFLSQENRPEAMEYFDFVMSEVHGLRIKELLDAKKAGRKVVGAFCVYVPEETVLAADGICVGLCAGADFATEEVERYLPRNTCALIKSFFGFKLGKVCPYIESADLVAGETTCDGKKKAYELFGEIQKDLYVMELPQMKGAQDRELWRKEVLRFKEKMEELSGVEITAERLADGIRRVNVRRRVLQRLAKIRYRYPYVISGKDALLINQVSFYDNPERFTENVSKLCDELEDRATEGIFVVEGAPKKIMLSGCPMAVPNWKFPVVVESSGAAIVGEESCIGERNTRDTVLEDGQTLEEMIERLVDRYMRIDCAVFTPNTERLDHIVEMARESGAEGVIHYSLQFCGPYTIEAKKVEDRLAQEGIPVLRIETDYSMEDVGQLQTRVEAFVEQLS